MRVRMRPESARFDSSISKATAGRLPADWAIRPIAGGVATTQSPPTHISEVKLRNPCCRSPIDTRVIVARICASFCDSRHKHATNSGGDASGQTHLPQDQLRRLAPAVAKRAADAHMVMSRERPHGAGYAARR